MAKKIKKNFERKLSLACGNDIIRPAMQHLAFRDGMVCATDAHLLVVQSLKLHGFTDEEIEQMEGKVIHRNTFDEIFRYDYVVVEDGHFVCTKDEVIAKFPLKKPDFKYPSFDNVFPDKKSAEPLLEIGMNLRILERAAKLTLAFNKMAHFEFNRPNRAILVKGTDLTWEDEKILIMPLMLNN